MNLDFLKGLLLLLVLVIIGSWMTKPDFSTKNPGIASFLGFAGSSSGTASTQPETQIKAPTPANNQDSGRAIKIIGASVSFEGEYGRIILRVNKNSGTTNLSQYILKTSNGSYYLPALNLKAGDYVIITSGIYSGGSSTQKISSNQYEVFLSQRFLSSGYETAELYNSAGVLISKYTYGLSALFQGEFGKEILLPS